MARILVVDDSSLMRSMSREFLRHMEHEVITAETGKRALEVVGREKPDMILMDVHLPDMTGFQVCQKLREAGFDSPILLTSGSDAYSPWIHQLAQGFLFKPYTETVLRSKVQALLGNGGPDAQIPVHGASWDSPVNLIHHLCGSVGSMSGLLDLLKAKKDDEEFLDKSIALMEQSVHNSMALVEEFAKLIRPLELKKQSLQLENWFRRIVSEHSLSQSSNISVRWQIDTGSLAPILIDPQLMARVVNAILQNAIESMPNGGTVTLGAYADLMRQWLYLSFQDTGSGMEDYISNLACIAFFTMKKGRRGTGLSWAQKIVQAHGGGLEITSTPHVGTSVLLRLPMDQRITSQETMVGEIAGASRSGQ